MNRSYYSPLADPFLPGQSSQYGPLTPLSPPHSYFEHKSETQFYQPLDVQSYQRASPVERPRPQSVLHLTKRTIYKFWLVELLATCASLIALIILYGIMKRFDLKPVARSGFYSGLPTALVNAFTTIMRTAMLLPVATALAQLQWSWFQTEKELLDIETFDDATRGVFGSILLLAKMGKSRFWHLAAIGALLTVASFALETVVGSAIVIVVKGGPLPDLVATPRTNRYEWAMDQATGRTLGDQVPIPAMISAIDSGLSAGISYGHVRKAGYAIITPSCNTSYCDFRTYQTIAVDHYCQDISNQLSTDSESGDYYVPSNAGLSDPLPLNANSGYINSTVSFQYPDSSFFSMADNVGPLIANVFIIANLASGQRPFAVECVLFWTVFTFKSSTTAEGGWNETLVSITNSSTSLLAKDAAVNPKNDNLVLMNPTECWINGTVIANHSSVEDPIDQRPECIHFVTPEAQLGLQNWLSNRKYGLPGWATFDSTEVSWADTNPFITYLISVLLPLDNNSEAEYNIDQYIFHNLAVSMTNTIRQLPRQNLTGPGAYNYWARGTMFDSMRFHVRWPLMIFPTLIVFGSALFTFIVAKRAREHLWKRSNLPLLFHGLGTREKDACGEIDDYVDMRAKARDMKVKLSTTTDGQVRFVEVRDSVVASPLVDMRSPSVAPSSFVEAYNPVIISRKPVGSIRTVY